MILHLITDRRRLSGDGAGLDEQSRRLLEQLTEAIEAGIDFVQIRERDLSARELAALVLAMVARARGSHTRILVNDRLDVAIAAGAAGVHLRGGSISPSSARTMAPPGFVIGRLVHNPDQARHSGDADYLVAGTVWETPSKPAGHALLGVDGLAAVVRASSVPVLAIGGVTLERISQVAEVKVAGIAAIGLFMPPQPSADKTPEHTRHALRDLAAAARVTFELAARSHPC